MPLRYLLTQNIPFYVKLQNKQFYWFYWISFWIKVPSMHPITDVSRIQHFIMVDLFIRWLKCNLQCNTLELFHKVTILNYFKRVMYWIWIKMNVNCIRCVLYLVVLFYIKLFNVKNYSSKKWINVNHFFDNFATIIPLVFFFFTSKSNVSQSRGNKFLSSLTFKLVSLMINDQDIIGID
jgi:hypothetical protein